MPSQYVVVAYDIADDARRTRLFAKLKGLGWRKQFSVFECFTTPERLLQTKHEFEQLIDTDEDTVIYYHLCANCQEKIERVGIEKGGAPDQDLTII